MSPDALFLAKARLASRGCVSVVLRGESMHPFFEDGDVARIEPAKGFDLGCLYAYFDGIGNRIIVHRLVGMAGGSLVLKGDHTRWCETVSRSCVLGKVTAIQWKGSGKWVEIRNLRYGGVAVSFLSRGVAESFSHGKVTGVARIHRAALCRLVDLIGKVERIRLAGMR